MDEMYFFIFKTNGFVNHVIKAKTLNDARGKLKELADVDPRWDHFGASFSVVHCEYIAQQNLNLMNSGEL